MWWSPTFSRTARASTVRASTEYVVAPGILEQLVAVKTLWGRSGQEDNNQIPSWAGDFLAVLVHGKVIYGRYAGHVDVDGITVAWGPGRSASRRPSGPAKPTA
jgi:hypothetical protein